MVARRMIELILISLYVFAIATGMMLVIGIILLVKEIWRRVKE